MTTVADILEGIPVWAAPGRGVCTYCASPGRERVQVLPPAPPAGCCRVCGEELEPLHCVPGVECEPPHTGCPDCPVAAAHCTGCEGAGTAGCVFCHGTGRERPNHCCDCQHGAGDCRCILVATPEGLVAAPGPAEDRP